MAAEDLLRLAWEADHDGRPGLRDALLTLAVTESRPDDGWAEPCRARLVRERPDHYLGEYATVRLAIQDPRVIASRDRLRKKYPEGRVGWLLLRAYAARGPFLGRPESLDAMIDDLAETRAEAENVRRDAAQGVRGPLSRNAAPRPLAFSLAYPPMTGYPTPIEVEPESPDFEETITTDARGFEYLSILFAVAMLLATLLPRDGETSFRV